MGFFRQTSRTLWWVNQIDKIALKGEDHLAWLDQTLAKRNGDEKLKQRILADYARRLENRAKKAEALKTHAHCQICERSIQANTGLIAHHGYQRPGHGWQTASCYGARFPAYEHSNNAMQPYIDMVERHMANRKAGLNGLLTEPPSKFTVTVKIQPYEVVEHTRPAGFDAAKVDAADAYDVVDKYSREWRHRVYTARTEIKNAEHEIARMTKRLAAWKPKKGKAK